MAREAVMLWTITVISLVLLQLPYTYGQKRTGTIFKNNNHNSWSEVSEVNSDETTSEMVTATSESTNETTSEMVMATSESTNETTSEMVTATSESTNETTSEMVTATSESTNETTSEMVTATSESTNETTSEMVTATSESTNETTSEMVTATSESTIETTSEMVTATSESTNETTSEVVTATSESTIETTSEMVTATSESTNETTSEMTPPSGCDISIPSKLMDFCRINESVPCDEVWHHVDPKCYVIGGAAVAAVVMLLLVVVICCLCHCTRLHSCCRRGYQSVGTGTPNGSVEGGKMFEMKNLADCLKSSRRNSSQGENDQIVLGSIAVVCCCCCCCEYKKRGNQYHHLPTSDAQKELRAMAQREVSVERRSAADHCCKFFEDSKDYDLIPSEYQCDAYLGCRLQKHWCKGKKKSSEKDVLVTQSPISKKCPFELDSEIQKKIDEILNKVGQHHHIHPILKIEVTDDGIFIVQLYSKKGSLRDMLNKNANPDRDWDKKYGIDKKNKKPLKKKEIFEYGCQLSEAFLYLYELGFPPLGNVHTGNIFITKEGIKLGGYENVLLGYRTRLYQDIEQEDCLRQIDGIMFGHAIFEMTCGFEPERVFPTDEDYQKVEDDEVREILRRIFAISTSKKDYIALMREIMHIPQFIAIQHASPTESEALSSGANDLLKQVRDKVVGGKKIGKKKKRDKKVPTPTTESWKTPDNIAAAKEIFCTQVPSTFETQIGRRSERIWMIKEGSTQLQTITKIPQTCPIYLSTSFQTLSELTQDLAQCPFLLPLVECEYSKVNGHHLVSMLYPLQEEGSLRDVMYGTKPIDGWESKMTAIKGRKQDGYTCIPIASFGHQILRAMEFLRRLGFLPLGHVHTGNIYVEGDMCRLGGYENTLLGYRTHRYDLYSSRGKEFIDVIMFGHVLYEMIYMRELTTLTPSKEEYESIKVPELKEALQYVFADGFSHSISDILELPFFKSASLPVAPQNPIQPSTLSARVKYLLEKVRKGKHRDQADTLNEFRTKGHLKLKEARWKIKMT